MGIIWQVAISNAALVAAGTPLVWLIGRYARRPALTHGLAVILLLKLITPPLWRVPLNWPEEPAAAPIAAHVDAVVNKAPADYHVVAKPTDAQLPPENVIIESVSAPPSEVPAVSPVAAPAPVAAKFDFDHWCRRAIFVFGWVWVAGSALCVIVAAARVILFTRALRFATRARDVQPRADMLARRLGLRHSPAVWFVPAHVPPMLWSVGRHPKLLLPRGLWERLDIPGRDTILLHELAHWRRGDPVVRWIELLATCLYWWHPACWWARRELREAEEQCCDAWVLWAMPGIFKNYANALLEAVEYASLAADRPSARSAVPALASRMGQFVHLRRRLTMLKHGNIARALSWGGLAGVMTLGSIVLPLTPTWGQERTEPPDPAVGIPQTPPPPTLAPETSPAPEAAPQGAGAPGTAADLKFQLEEARQSVSAAELAQAKQNIAELQKELEKAIGRLQLLEDRARHLPAGPSWRKTMPPATGAPPANTWPQALSKAQEQYEVRIEGPGSIHTQPPGPAAGAGGAAPRMTIRSVDQNGEVRVSITDPATGRTQVFQGRALDVNGAAPLVSQSERLDKIERELRMLMDEIATMRRPAPPAPASPSPEPFTPERR